MIVEKGSELSESLSELMEIEGIIGVLICRNDGDLMASTMPTVFDSTSVAGLSKKFSRILTSVKELKMSQEGVSFLYDEGKIILKDLRRGFLVIISSVTEENPLMEMTITMVKKKLIRFMSFKKGATAGAVSADSQAEVKENTAETEETIPAEKIKQLNTELCRYLGPAGGVVIKKKSQKLGFSWNKIPVSSLGSFLSALTGMIKSDSDAESFKLQAASLLKEYL